MKNTHARLVSLFLTLGLLLGMLPPPLAHAAANYPDTIDHWAEQAINYWSERGVVRGTGSGFNPDGDMTRAEAAQIFSNLLKLKKSAPLDEFSDVDPNAWYADALSKVVAKGILTGVGGGRMEPDGTLTREQLFVMFARAMGIPQQSGSSRTFVDGSAVSDWAVGYINTLADKGYVNGIRISDNTFNLAPAQYINRASVVSLLDQSISLYADVPGSRISAPAGTGLALVVAGNVTVSGVMDDLVISSAADKTSVTLNNATVSGLLTMDAAAQLTLSGRSKVENTVISASAQGAKVMVNSASSIDNVTVNADGVTVSGNGSVNSVLANGNNTTVTTSGTTVTASETATGTMADGKAVFGGNSYTTKKASSDSSSSSDDSGSTEPPVNTEEPGPVEPTPPPAEPQDTLLLPSENSSYVSFIGGESHTITLNSAPTYIYTVDTDKGNGYTVLSIATVGEFLNELTATEGSVSVQDASGVEKTASDPVADTDIVIVTTSDETFRYTLTTQQGAPRGQAEVVTPTVTAGTASDIKLRLTAGLRGPMTQIVVEVPAGINATLDNTTVDVIGRGTVPLSQLSTQSMGKVFSDYDHDAVGHVSIAAGENGGQVITFSGLDLRALNRYDLELTFQSVTLPQAGEYPFSFYYVTSPVTADNGLLPSYEKQELPGMASPQRAVTVTAVPTITSFARVIACDRIYNKNTNYQAARFTWNQPTDAQAISLLASTDKGQTWNEHASVSGGAASVYSLSPDTEYWFKLSVTGGANAGESNIAKLYTGKVDVRSFGAIAGDGKNDRDAIDAAIDYAYSLGGGTVLFTDGVYDMNTVHLKSNVYLYIDSTAELRALKNADAPETTWWSDKDYRSGTSATSTGPYRDPNNYLTKQDVGHTYFRNCMFFAEREDNIKIIGNGKLTGNGNLQTGDKVMDNSADNRADKMFTMKLCTNVEIGGLTKGDSISDYDLWYYETNKPNSDQPFYVDPAKAIDKAYLEAALTQAGVDVNAPTLDQLNAIEGVDTDIDNMLHIARAGHFVLLATGTDGIDTHDVYADKSNGGVRDIFDYMGSGDVRAINIYAEGSSDDIVKPGSDCSLGYTRPVSTFKVRNIIGDTNCNLFQIGSETADDIQDIYIDNIYVLAGNKAGFSISTNDGGYIKNIFLNAGGTNPGNLEDPAYVSDGTADTSRYAKTSEMRRTRAPFFVSISNRGRTMGGSASTYEYDDGTGKMVKQLLSDNVAIGRVENIMLHNVNIEELYAGSKYKDLNKRWDPYKAQNKAAPIISGYAVPTVFGSENKPPVLPVLNKDGSITSGSRQTGYIENIAFTNVHVLTKGGNSLENGEALTPEMAVGKYNVGDLALDAMGTGLPAYGFWFRHVENLAMDNCSTSYETSDDRYALVLDDVLNANMQNLTMQKGQTNSNLVQLRSSSNISLSGQWYVDSLDTTTPISFDKETIPGKQTYPNPLSNCTDIQTAVDGFAVGSGAVTVPYGTTPAQLKAALTAVDGSHQTYSVSGRADNEALSPTDVLTVTSETGVSATYSITISPSTSTQIQIIDKDVVFSLEGSTLTVNRDLADRLTSAIASDDGSVQTYSYDKAAGTLTVTAADGNTKKVYTVTLVEDLRLSIQDGAVQLTAVDGSVVRALLGTTLAQLEAELKAPAGATLNVESAVKVTVSKGGSSLTYTVEYAPAASGGGEPVALVEGESTGYTSSGMTADKVNNNNAQDIADAHGSANRQFTGPKGAYVDYTITVPAPGSYSLRFCYKLKNTNRTSTDVLVNGQKVGAVNHLDPDPAKENLYEATDFPIGRLEAGEATVRFLITGSTNSFIVDYFALLAQGQASGSTNIKADGLTIDNDARTLNANNTSFTVSELLKKLSASDTSKQAYRLTDAQGTAKTEGQVENGDILIVTAQDGTHTSSYPISGVPNIVRIDQVEDISGVYVVDAPSVQLTLSQSGATVKASSDDESVATVQVDGTTLRLTLLKAGTANITVSAELVGFATGTMTFSVTVEDGIPITGISLDKDTLSLGKGDTDTLTARFEPDTATLTDMKWATSNAQVAHVSGGTITATGAGTATITVTSWDGRFSATCEVTVSEKAVAATSLTMNRETAVLAVGESSLLGAYAQPWFADPADITWTSSASDTVSVSNGVIKGLKEGEATITASRDGLQATCTVTVTTSLKPYNLHSPQEARSYDAVTLLWDKPSDLYTTDLKEYVVYQNGVEVGTTDKMGYSPNNLTANTEYTFRVDARHTDDTVETGPQITVKTQPAPTQVIDITKAPYNAVADGGRTATNTNGRTVSKDGKTTGTVNTKAIQQAIDDCPEGGEVYIPEGVFVTGALFLKSNMTLRIDGTLLGSTDLKDYPLITCMFEGWEIPGSYASLLTLGELDVYGPANISNVVICGKGQIDGSGLNLDYAMGGNGSNSTTNPQLRKRSRSIVMMNAENIYIRDLNVLYGPAWTIHAIVSSGITFDSLHVESKDGSTRVRNGDGIGSESSSNINYFNCNLWTGDDSITVKSGKNELGWRRNIPCENIRITNCSAINSQGGFVIGSEMSGGVRNILMQDNEITNPNWEGIDIKSDIGRGGLMETIIYRDMYIDKARIAVRFSFKYGTNNDGDRAPVPPELRNVLLENVTGANNSTAVEIIGLPTSKISHITMVNCAISGNAKTQAETGVSARAYLQDVTDSSFENVKINEGAPKTWGIVDCENISGISQDLQVIDPTNTQLAPPTDGMMVTLIDNGMKKVTVKATTTVKDVLQALKSADGGRQSYSVQGSDQQPKAESEEIIDTDTLIVTAQDGQSKAQYSFIVLEPSADPLKYDCQNLTYTKQSASGINTANNDRGGKYVQFQTKSSIAVNDWLEFTVDNVPVGKYTVALRFKYNTNGRGAVDLFIDGSPTALGTVDEDVGSGTYHEIDIGEIEFAQVGSHTFRFVVKRANNLNFDQIILTPAAKAVQANAIELDFPEADASVMEPTQDTPVENAPSEDTPSEDKSSEDAPSENAPSEDKPSEDTPSENAPSEDKPSEDTPSEDAPSEDKPSEDTPSEDAPSEDKPSEDTPSEDAPSEDAVSEDVSSTDMPSEDAPSENASSEDKSSEDTPPQDEPIQMGEV